MKKAIKISLFSLLGVVATYILVCAIILGIDFLHMVIQNNTAGNITLGESRIEELNAQGIQVKYKIYSEEEIKEEPNKNNVILNYFPNYNNDKTKYVLVVPGGGYATCEAKGEGYPPAAEINKLGYTAFVLEYRAGNIGGEYAAINDISKAVSYINNNADMFNVDITDYAMMGFSAGGNAIGLFAADKVPYVKYPGYSKPSALLMGYPWANPNIKSWNVCKVLTYHILNEFGYKGLFGKLHTKEIEKYMNLPWQIDSSFPKTYIMHGDKDMLVPANTHSDILVEALKQNNVECIYEKVKGLNHACGVGKSTNAEGWISHAISFWNNK